MERLTKSNSDRAPFSGVCYVGGSVRLESSSPRGHARVPAPRIALLFALAAGVVTSMTLGACGPSDDHPPHASGIGNGSQGSGGLLEGTGGSGDGDCEGPPQLSETGPCGNEIVPVVQEKPNLYFVLDASGSMAETLDGSSSSRLTAAKSAITDVLHELGHRIRYGLAAYPGFGADSCAAGAEIFETKEGDPVQCVNKRRAGPVLSSFAAKLAAIEPGGGTSIAATLEEITPIVSALEGETFVVLVTDGAPNCNDNAACGVNDCMLNIEGLRFNDIICDDSFNCCDPDLVGDARAGSNCVDRSGTLDAVTALSDAGVKTYVVGVPGSEFYATLLDQLAEAGGTARAGEAHAYYPVSDTDSLNSVLKSIGTSVSTSCDITLQDALHIDEKTINVYFDARLIESDPDDGWTYEYPTVTLHGAPCDELLSGEVVQVQVVAGCPTIIK